MVEALLKNYGKDSETAGDALGALELLQKGPFAYFEAGENGVITAVNNVLLNWLGYTRDEVVGKLTTRDLMTKSSYDSWVHGNPRFRLYSSLVGEMDYARKDGSTFPGIGSAAIENKPDGSFLRVRSIFFDISTMRGPDAPEHVLRERLLAAVESSQQPFAIFDPKDELVLCNSAFRSSFEEAVASKVVGRSFHDIYENAARLGLFDLEGESVDAFVERRMAFRETSPTEGFTCKTADGRTWRSMDRRTAEGGWVTTIWDLTEDAMRTEELRAARKAADVANAAKSAFLTSMSHELRTPLNAILGFSQLLSRDGAHPLDARQKGWVRYIHKSAEHLLHLIEEVLDLSRIETGNVPISIEPVAIDEVLNEVTSTLAPMATRASIELTREGPYNDLPQMLADRTRLRQVLLNLGSNAIKYNRPGGSVKITAQVTETGRVRIMVTDTGVGIAESRHELVFEPFQRLGHEVGPIEGAGIGLSLVKRLAHLMKCDIGFRSVEGEGSDFWIDLPTARDKGSMDAPTPPPAPRPERPRARVLYIEDNPANIALMEAVLADLDSVTLVTAQTAEVGLEIAKATMPDLVIFDINLPGMDGYRALEHLRAAPETQDIPAIALSASAMDRDKKRAEAAGFARYLTKPVRLDELLEALGAFLPSSKFA